MTDPNPYQPPTDTDDPLASKQLDDDSLILGWILRLFFWSVWLLIVWSLAMTYVFPHL